MLVAKPQLAGIHEMRGLMQLSLNYFVGPQPPFIINLPYDHPHSLCS